MSYKSKKFIIYFLLLLVSFSWACKKDDEVSPQNETNYSLVNNWIWEAMTLYYYWNDEIPDIEPSSTTDPETYFTNLLYSDDEFSWITDDAEGLMAELEGSTVSMGYSPAFGLFSNGTNVFIVVEFVYRNSPAEKAGLKRGDIILAINGLDLTVDNYYDLYSQSSYSVTLGTYTGSSISKTSATLSMTAELIEMDPVLYSDVLEYNGTKVGYLVYAEFISGQNDKWLNSLSSALEAIKNEGATELIVDLRYNPGGEIATAGYLASMIAPKSVSDNHEILVKVSYNDGLQEYITSTEGADSESLIFKFPSVLVNLNLDQVVFLTSGGTASASELLINGLEPYMNTIQIGEPTVGKYYGSFVLTDFNEPAQHNWAIMPLVLKYENANGFSDFKDGLTPDYAIDDNLLNAKPFGDTSDPQIAKAIEVLTGAQTSIAARTAVAKPYIRLTDENRIKKGNILIKTSFNRVPIL